MMRRGTVIFAAIALLLVACNGAGTAPFFGPPPNAGFYIMDGTNSRVIRISDLIGAGFVVYGSFGSGVGNFNDVSGIVVGPDNKIYVDDTNNKRIVRMNDMSGSGWTTFGSLGAGTNQFSLGEGIVLDASKRIYVADGSHDL